ncbi:MAG: hypothetical protein ABIT01_11515 [Thermoanaerobaculia bacterium]
MHSIENEAGPFPDETRPLRVVGEANGSANPFVQIANRLVVGDFEVVLDLSAFEIEDDFAVAQCVNALRELIIRGAHIAITGAPENFRSGVERAGLLLAPTTLRIAGRPEAPA